jgi:excisionase family DNA binding protein
MPSPLVTVAQFAELIQLHPKTVYALAKAGKLPGARYFGGSLRIVVAEALGLPSGVASPTEASGLLKEDSP